MDLGLNGKRAAVAACVVGPRVRQSPRRSWPKAPASRSAAATRAASTTAAAKIGRERGAARGGRVDDRGGATQFVAAAHEALGGLDILVTNGGGPPPGDFASTPARRLRRRPRAQPAVGRGDVLRRGARHAGAAVGPRRRDHVDRGAPAHRRPILSNTARTGATGFLRTLAREVAKDGVTVNSVLPGISRHRPHHRSSTATPPTRRSWHPERHRRRPRRLRPGRGLPVLASRRKFLTGVALQSTAAPTPPCSERDAAITSRRMRRAVAGATTVAGTVLRRRLPRGRGARGPWRGARGTRRSR